MGSISGSDAVSAIKEVELDSLVLELNDDVDKIEYILRQVEMLVYDTSDYFKGDVADSIRNKFNTYSVQIETLKNNLLSYPKDLLKIKTGQKDNDQESANILNEYSTELSAEAKETRI